MKSLNAYLTFDGNTREAMTFYQQCLGGDLQMHTFAQAPEGVCPPGSGDRIMHASLCDGPATLMASDTMPGMPFQPGNNFSISVNCQTLDEVESVFAAFAVKGTVIMPLADAFWGARFGMVTDQFGIRWMFHYELPKTQ